MRRLIILFAAFCLLSQISNAQVAYYPFNGNTDDSTGNGHSLIGADISYGTGKDGVPNSAALLNGNTSWMYTNNFLAGKDSFTISMWVKSNSSSQRSTLAYAGNSNLNGNGLVLDMCNTLNNGDNVSPLCGGVRWLCNTNVHLAQSVWTHIAMVKSSKTYKLFINGSMVHSDTCTAINPSNYFLVGGNLLAGNGNSLNGLIDELKVFNFSLSNAQINSLYTGITGISNIETALRIFPNPVHNSQKLKIESSNEILLNGSLSVYTMQGKLLSVLEIDENGEATLPATIQNGVYLVRFVNQNQTAIMNLKLMVLD